MLVLSRKNNEAVVCFLPDGTEIRVSVIEIRGDKIRLGFEAPKSVVIHREEIVRKIQNTKEK